MLLVLGLAAAAARPSAWCGRLLCGRHRQDCSHELDGRDGLDWTVSVRVSLAAQPNYHGPQGKQEEEGREGQQPEEPEGLLGAAAAEEGGRRGAKVFKPPVEAIWERYFAKFSKAGSLEEEEDGSFGLVCSYDSDLSPYEIYDSVECESCHNS